MCDPSGAVLAGIEGQAATLLEKADGSFIGADFIRMQPGAAFALHVHHGDHILYIIGGSGYVFIDGRDIRVTIGHVVHIPAERPHREWVADEVRVPLTLLSIGHPHAAVTSAERMSLA